MKTILASLALAAPTLVLCACHQDSSSLGPPDVGSMTNLGLAAGRVAGDGRLLVVGVSEAAHNADRNLDGDLLDEVAYAYDVESGSGVDLGIDVSPDFPFPLEVRGDLAAIVVSEAGQGADLNDDGDLLDDVLEVYQLGQPAGLRGPSLALAPHRPLIDDEWFGRSVAFAVSEADEGNTDLNGDGDTLDAVPRLFRVGGDATGPALAVTALLGLQGSRLAFTTDEAQHGSDLNGDGDEEDTDVLQFCSPGSTDASNSGLDTSHVASSFRLSPIPEPQFDWFVLVSEQASGIDLDGDGSADDVVAHLYTDWEPRVINLELACLPRAPLVDDMDACLLAPEAPGRDRNGDGDFEDVTPVIVNGTTNTLLHVPWAVEPSLGGVSWTAGPLAFDVHETGQGADLDGDGDRSDFVAHVVDRWTGRTRNLRLDSQGLTTTSQHVLIPRFELDSRADWNQDGDRQDTVLFVWEAESGRIHHTGVTGALLDASSTWILLGVQELADGRDWNADGDVGDLVYVRHHLADGRNSTLGLTGAFPGEGHVLASDQIVVLVDEASQEQDLNQDGDELDSVPVVWE